MDKRIKKTRKNIINVFLDLLGEKKINEITAHEIAEIAEISRSTFYQHYTDVYNLLDQIEDEIFSEISSLLEAYSYEAIKNDPLRLFTELFYYFSENAKICLVLINKNGSITTGQRINKMIQEKFRNEWEALIHCGSELTASYLSQYIISGFVGILQEWIAGGMKEPEEEMAYISRMFINNSISENLNKMEVELKMSNFKEKIRTDAKGFASGILKDTSGLINEKSAEIQKKMESGLNTASGRLAQKADNLKSGQSHSMEEQERKRQKQLKKLHELDEKHKEKVNKLLKEGKQNKITEEQAKYEEEKGKIQKKLTELEAYN